MRETEPAANDLLVTAADEAIVYGYWSHEEKDIGAIVLDDHLTTAIDLEKRFLHNLKADTLLLKRNPRRERPAVLKRWASTLDVLERQVDWALRIREIRKLKLYIALAGVLFQFHGRALRAGDRAMTSNDSRAWLLRRREFGEKLITFLDEVGGDDGLGGDALKEELRLLKAVMMADYVALPILTSADAAVEDVCTSEAILQAALALLLDARQTVAGDLEVAYWRSKCYRHLAMAAIKTGRWRRALLRLANSGLFIRHVIDKDHLQELATELRRGYAEVNHLLHDQFAVRDFLDGTDYRPEDIGTYIPPSAFSDDQVADEVPLRVILVRHQERDSDEVRKFGFAGDVTARGQEEFHFIVRTVNRILQAGSIYSVVVVSSDGLREEAKDFGRHLEDLAAQNEGHTLSIRYVERSSWNPIEVGEFFGKTELEAQGAYPGVYHVLARYRLRKADGYELEFPGGEPVRAFEERIAVQFARLLDLLADADDEDTIASSLAEGVLIVYGHTSTLTAVLNLCSDFRVKQLGRAKYAFHPIQTGTVVEGKIELRKRAWQAEEHRLSY